MRLAKRKLEQETRNTILNRNDLSAKSVFDLSLIHILRLNIPVCGMVKDDYHRTRGLYYENQEIAIDKNSEAFRLITRIQDEAHRFAIEYLRMRHIGLQSNITVL